MAKDNSSELGVGDMFAEGGSRPIDDATSQKRGSRGIVVGDASDSRGWGRGPVPVDPRRYKYDRMRALSQVPVSFSATKVDRLDAEEAGDVLHRIHVMLGIEAESEERLFGFDCALWWQHILNGASIMQPGRGVMVVDGMSYDIHDCLRAIGAAQLRRFFRAFADDIVDVARGVLRGYDPYDVVAAEKHGQLMQVATSRGLHKYPEYAFDAADACLQMSLEARRAVLASKALVLPKMNTTDRMSGSTGHSIFADDSVVPE